MELIEKGISLKCKVNIGFRLFIDCTVAYRYRFNGQEGDDEIAGVGNIMTAEFWMYDGRLGRRWNVDPETHNFPWQSPLTTFDNNPVLMIDPSGSNANPIFDPQGNMLGTDDKGLQGEAIVMEASKFKQGMSHDEAEKSGTYFSKLPAVFNPDVIDKIKSTISTLPSRPDYDGKISLDEANKWYREGRGKPLYADLSKIDLKFISPSYFANNKTRSVQTLYDSEDGTVYGNITLTTNGGTKVTAKYDEYNFEMHTKASRKRDVTDRMSENFGRAMRNGATFGGRVRASQSLVNKGQMFKIYFYGKGTIGTK